LADLERGAALLATERRFAVRAVFAERPGFVERLVRLLTPSREWRMIDFRLFFPAFLGALRLLFFMASPSTELDRSAFRATRRR
jgi:hypothetical protein